MFYTVTEPELYSQERNIDSRPFGLENCGGKKRQLLETDGNL